MARIRAIVVVIGMATRTSIRGIGVIAVVAGHAVVSDGYVRPGKRIMRIVIKCRRRPGILSVAKRTIGWKLVHLVIGGGGEVVLVSVAAGTGSWRIVIVAMMARCAIIGNRGVGSV